ncbi:AP-1 complex subunit mu-1-like [Chiloscyllium plagiosum]|uniref:AP-1 complex subunit mu-1-like n=1 Tax=Chiloscyllium plagiosum TaxID=36176 RepID=UPI001CB7B1FB|nr:AP-1 complex subunit mu-1-like [Chiloscyllium plagiosum]
MDFRILPTTKMEGDSRKGAAQRDLGFLRRGTQNASVQAQQVIKKENGMEENGKWKNKQIRGLPSGQLLICRNYKGDVDMSEIEHFIPMLTQKEDEGAVSPLLTRGKVHFLWIKHSNLYLVATTTRNANASLVYAFLYKVVQVFTEYFKELEEESIRDNFVIIYELLDEVMDFGFPQTTDSKILQEYITQQGHKLEVAAPRPPATVTNAVSWRSEGIKYKKNEVFIDVIEGVNVLVSANGNVLQSEIVGSVKLRVFLSGMPELRLGLNDKVLFELTGPEGQGATEALHHVPAMGHTGWRWALIRLAAACPGGQAPEQRCEELKGLAKHKKFRSKNLSLDLNRLRTVGQIFLQLVHVKPLIWIESVIETFSHSRVEYLIKARSQFKKQSVANNVEIVIPVPSDADSPKFKTTMGSAKWVPENNTVVWTIKSLPGGKEYLMRAHFGLPSVESETTEGKRPISVKFEIPYFTVSGVQVRYMKIIEKSGYQALPWVRYITQSGDYQLRVH